MYQKSSLESIQIAWGYVLRDFRQWCKPEGQAMWRWKTAPLKQCIMAAKSSMIDDAEAMLRAWSENQNTKDSQGMSAFLPVMTTAIASIQTPPEHEQVVGRADWLDVVIPNDPLERVVKMRTMPSAFRCQIAFFCPDAHGAMMLANQFCLYFKSEKKRTFGVDFEIGEYEGKPITDTWRFRVLDNSLYPDRAMSEYQNLHIVTVDCTIIGDIPVVVGLGGEHDKLTDTVEMGVPANHQAIKGEIHNALDGSVGHQDGNKNGKDTTTHTPQTTDELGEFALKDDIVRQADIHHHDKSYTRVSADDDGINQENNFYE